MSTFQLPNKTIMSTSTCSWEILRRA